MPMRYGKDEQSGCQQERQHPQSCDWRISAGLWSAQEFVCSCYLWFEAISWKAATDAQGFSRHFRVITLPCTNSANIFPHTVAHLRNLLVPGKVVSSRLEIRPERFLAAMDCGCRAAKSAPGSSGVLRMSSNEELPLTCLSSGCLSSYLIFSASFSE